jgi:hypothetical protein
MQDIDRKNAIHIGIWTRIGGYIRISDTQSPRSSNYEHDRTKRSIGEAESIDDNGGR